MRSVSPVAVAWLFFVFMGETSGAEKIRVGFVSPAPGLSAPWIAKETGGFARHGLDADVILLTGSPRLVQSLIAGDVRYALVGAAAVMRAAYARSGSSGTWRGDKRLQPEARGQSEVGDSQA